MDSGGPAWARGRSGGSVPAQHAPLELGGTTLDWTRPYVVGVLNVTPDSFSDGGLYADIDSAVAHAQAMVRAGADIVDVGGESTRPGAQPVGLEEELDRTLPIVRALAERLDTPISIDTTKAQVAEAAVTAGASIVNDISGGRFDPDMIDTVARTGAAYVLGHAPGDTLAEVHAAEPERWGYEPVALELAERVARLPAPLRERTVVDPGLGFGKGTRENVELLRRSGELGAALGRPVMVGPSRKRFVGALTGKPVSERDDGTIGAALAAIASGAELVRVHDPARVVPAITVFCAALGGA